MYKKKVLIQCTHYKAIHPNLMKSASGKSYFVPGTLTGPHKIYVFLDLEDKMNF